MLHEQMNLQTVKDKKVLLIHIVILFEKQVVRFWRPAYDSLKNVCRICPRNYPEYITLDSNLLGFLLINKETCRCLCSLCPVNNQTVVDTDDNFSSDQRKEILESFYKKITGSLFTSVVEGSQTGPLEFSHQPQETYIVGEAHKCYAMQSGPYQLFVLFTDSIPTFAMRSVCHKTLAVLTRDKCIQV
ncbi:hypothetical protein KUTeg_022755 [Tegillarca granosa]|uniref:FUZ/MON1/HPS1 third Longin domain-containing protein n=1 Tax=Tegillarca granosa TaxID=220873 RepID=A0ABQ9E5C0_TEGGR|nr:hypothetical protein KUTeg_022746 [Tegillarca granosa]KAJ8298695.1 hypothetical protein KUTeg_022755 [Tegillarca granosa]